MLSRSSLYMEVLSVEHLVVVYGDLRRLQPTPVCVFLPSSMNKRRKKENKKRKNLNIFKLDLIFLHLSSNIF